MQKPQAAAHGNILDRLRLGEIESGAAARRVSIKVNPYAMKGTVNDGFFSILIVRVDN